MNGTLNRCFYSCCQGRRQGSILLCRSCLVLKSFRGSRTGPGKKQP